MNPPPVSVKISSSANGHWLLDRIASGNRLRALSVAALVGPLFLAAGALRAQNTELDVATETTTPQANPPNLNVAAGYTANTAPTTTSDVTFNATNFYSDTFTTTYTPPTGVFAISGNGGGGTNNPPFSVGTLDDLSTSQAITLTNGNTNTPGPIILNGGTDSVPGSAAGDLLYVATGATLNISNVKPNNAAVGNTISLSMAISGNFDVVGTATISAPIASGFLGTGGALTTNPNGFTKTGAGMLTLSSATNNYSGVTIVNAGTLATGGTGNLGTGNVTLTSTAVLTLGNSASLANAATLRFAATNTINLNNATVDTLATIIDTSAPTVKLAPGTYTAAQLNANFGVNSFAGAGTLTVTTAAVPEPSTWTVIAVIVGLAGLTRRQQLGAWLRRDRA